MNRPAQRARVIAYVEAAWTAQPDLRFGQLVENLLLPEVPDPPEHWRHCIYHLTDNEIERKLQGYD